MSRLQKLSDRRETNRLGMECKFSTSSIPESVNTSLSRKQPHAQRWLSIRHVGAMSWRSPRARTVSSLRARTIPRRAATPVPRRRRVARASSSRASTRARAPRLCARVRTRARASTEPPPRARLAPVSAKRAPIAREPLKNRSRRRPSSYLPVRDVCLITKGQRRANAARLALRARAFAPFVA